jgi:hypothetical protein
MAVTKTCFLLDCTRLDAFSRHLLMGYRQALAGLCDVIAIVHDGQSLSGSATGLEDGVLTLDHAAIFQEIAHSKDVARGLIPGNPDLKLIAAARRLPGYEFYLRFEFDVICTRPLRAEMQRLLTQCERHDFVASFVHGWKDDGWMWWNSFVAPRGRTMALQGLKKAFLPMLGLSRSFLTVYERGHYEVTMATVADQAGQSCLDLSAGPAPFTSWPQFNIGSPQKLAEHLPAFIHPVKSLEDLRDLGAVFADPYAVT